MKCGGELKKIFDAFDYFLFFASERIWWPTNKKKERVSFLQRPSGLSHEDSSHLQEAQSRSAAAPHQKEAGGGASDFWLACLRLPGEAPRSCPAAWTDPGPAAGTTFPIQPWSICMFSRSWREDDLSGCADTANPAENSENICFNAVIFDIYTWQNACAGWLNLTGLILKQI